MKTIEVKPRELDTRDPALEAEHLATCIAGFVKNTRQACNSFSDPAQAGNLVDLLKEITDIWFGGLVTIEEKEA